MSPAYEGTVEASLEAAKPSEDEGLAVPGAQAIGRALTVLRAFGTGPTEMTLSQLADQCGLSPSTTHRICRALVAQGFLHQDEMSARYSLGHTVVLIGQLAQRNYGLDRASALLEAATQTTGESINLGILAGDSAMVLIRSESSHPLRLEQPPGTRVPLHASAMGKAFLAFSPVADEVLDRLMPLERFSPATITDRKMLDQELAQVRERGYSTDMEEGIVGVRCVGAPVLGPRGNAVAAVAIQVPTPRMPVERIGQLGPVVAQLAGRLAEVLPAGRPPFSVNS